MISGQFILLFYLLLSFINGQKYMPGTPGAPWSQDEILIVKSKLYSIMNSNGGYNAVKQIYGEGGHASWVDVPSAEKFLRLGFHDCLRYLDGTGGCDGCLFWEGIDSRFTDSPGKFQYENVNKTSNANLENTVAVLEYIYNDANFPLDLAPPLTVSLRDSGKSRADLWAFATMMAVEFSIESNNLYCSNNWQNNPGHQCWEKLGEDDCLIDLQRGFNFKTGRKDCTEFEGENETYKSLKEEYQPNPSGNGRMTVDFFKNEFNMNGRETVTLMGAHTIGRLHVWVSLYRYLWTTSSSSLFNNQYYRQIVRADSYMMSGDKACTRVPDAEYNKPKTRWVAHTRLDTKNGGPVHWIHNNYACPNCVTNPDNKCCQDVPEGHFCKPDSYNIEQDNDVNGGCESYKLISGLDEMAIPAEIGLYFDFNVTEDGVPYGCPGLEIFDPVHWNMSYQLQWSTLPKEPGSQKRITADPQCELNKLEEPIGSTPLYKIFEEYATWQNGWISNFIPVLEKMLSNSYASHELINTSYDYFDITCPRGPGNDKHKFTNCFSTSKTSKKNKFSVISKLDNRALECQDDGTVIMKDYDPENPRQIWVETNMGHQWINLATSQPMRAGPGRNWIYNGGCTNNFECQIYDARDTTQVLDRQSCYEEGCGVITSSANNSEDNKLWKFIQLPQ